MERQNIVINIAKDFSNTPGGRYETLGPYSGEEFYDKLLWPKYREAIKTDCKLVIELDGVKGYPYSFLDESFGKLKREIGNDVVKIIEFKQTSFEWIVDIICEKIWGQK